jgi:polyhydroxyalkanoate synthesis regulator phasin
MKGGLTDGALDRVGCSLYGSCRACLPGGLEKNMITQAQVEPTPVDEAEERPLFMNALGKLVLASIGAVGLAQDALEGVLHRMVERGEISRADAGRLVQELRGKRPDPRNSVHRMTESVRDAADIPARSDIQSLHAEIAALSAKLDQLAGESAPAKAAAKGSLPKTSS